MRNRFLLILSLPLFYIACKKNSGDHLPSKKMEQVMLDISIAETYSTMARDNTHLAGFKNTDSLSLYYRDIFAHHHITQQQFIASLNWYKAHPEELDSIYTNVTALADKYLDEENKKVKK